VAGLVVGDNRRQGKQGHDGEDTEKGDVDGEHKRFGLMNIFEKGIAVEETGRQDHNTEDGKAEMKGGADELAKQQRAYGNVGQVADFIGSPFPLFVVEHGWRSLINGTGSIADGLTASRGGAFKGAHYPFCQGRERPDGKL